MQNLHNALYTTDNIKDHYCAYTHARTHDEVLCDAAATPDSFAARLGFKRIAERARFFRGAAHIVCDLYVL